MPTFPKATEPLQQDSDDEQIGRELQPEYREMMKSLKVRDERGQGPDDQGQEEYTENKSEH